MPRPSFVVEQNNATGTVSYWEAGENQSVADAAGISLADYIHAMYFFIRKAKARRVLMIGCGGGTLATMLHRTGADVTVVDVSARSFEIAQRYFALPAAIACHVADGRAFLARSPVRYDAIALDAYDGDTIPRQFLGPDFFALAKSRLRPRGIFAMNIIVADDRDRTPDRIGRAAARSFRHVRLLDSDGWIDRNAVLVAGAVADLTRPRLLLKPRRRARRLAREIRDLDFRPLRD
ncbi:MAG: fused MFS/spermidine synthase [Rhizomicrobium sp.]